MKDKNKNIELQEELRQIAPGLSELKREDGFTVPYNYFKELPDKVITKVAAGEEKTSSMWLWLQSLITPKFALAFASVMILIIAGIWFARIAPEPELLASVTPDEALEYVLDNLEDFSSEDLAAAGVSADWDAVDLTPLSGDELDEMMNEMIRDESLMQDLMVN